MQTTCTERTTYMYHVLNICQVCAKYFSKVIHFKAEFDTLMAHEKWVSGAIQELRLPYPYLFISDPSS